MLHCDPNLRHDFVFLFDVKDGNPNGDPDAGNLPRFDPETMHGIVTDVCIKRKIRDYVAGVLGKDIFIQSELALNTLIRKTSQETMDLSGNPIGSSVEVSLLAETETELKKLLESEDNELSEYLAGLPDFEFEVDTSLLSYAGDAKSKKEFMEALEGDGAVPETLNNGLDAIAKLLVQAARNKKGKKIDHTGRGLVKHQLCKKYFDIRVFGAVLTAGTNFGQVRGPMQLTFSRSLDPIRPLDLSITRIAITKATDRERKTTEMGRKALVPYGLYRMHGFFNPMLGRGKDAKGVQEQLVTEQDMVDFWEALGNLFTFDRSAARGEMSVRKILIFTHKDEKGNAASHKLFELIKTKPCGGSPRSFDDYKENIIAPNDGELEEFPGVTLTTLA